MKSIFFSHYQLCYICLSCICFYDFSQGQDPFSFVKESQNSSFYSWIKNGGDCNVVNKDRKPLIVDVVQSRNIRLLKFLLRQQNILVNQKDANDKTALDYAIELENINEDSAMALQHLQYDICTSLVHKQAKVTSCQSDIKLRAFLLKGKPTYNKTLLGFCVDNSSNFVSCATAYKMSFLGPFVSVATNFIGSFFTYSIDRISQYRRFKKFNKSYLI